jgi:hypothetical protein
MKQSPAQIKRIRQTMRRINANYQRPLPHRGKLNTCSRRHARLANATLAAKKKYSHNKLL